jgi:hypothetical protein
MVTTMWDNIKMISRLKAVSWRIIGSLGVKLWQTLWKVTTGMPKRLWPRNQLKCSRLVTWTKEILWMLLKVWQQEWDLIVIYNLIKNFKTGLSPKNMVITISIPRTQSM